ncbi:MAG: class I SAM-dependent methyltransferase, partial [Candidatus Eisenbacteria bacterium]|nr:class I SAM-dependent methyltransferase [Candidatus Eisenbacteria bacterium]
MSISEQKSRMRTMFDSVAPRYDLLNHLLSMGIDRGWRKRAIRNLKLEAGDRLLDVCAGTGDLGFEAISQKDISVVGVDLAFNMLERGNQKRKERRFSFV